MPKQKICILTSVHSVFDARIFYKEAKALVNAGYDVTLIAQHNKEEIIDGIKIIPLPKPKNRWERFFKLDYLTYKKALQQKADLYHFHDPELLPWMMILKSKTKSKIIYDIHENTPQQILNKYWLPWIIRKPVSWLVSCVERLGSQIFDRIAPATYKIADRFPSAKTIVVQNFPDTTEILPNNLTPYTERPLSFVYAGAIAEIRGIKKIIYALKLLEDTSGIKFELAGSFRPNEFANELKTLTGWSLVNYHGIISRKQLAHLLNNVKAGLIIHQPVPNEIDAWPIKMFEYMAAGLPIITSDFPIWRKIVNDTKCGILVDPKNPKKIAEAMEWIIKNPIEAEAMGKRGRQEVELKYNWKNESKKLLKVYVELLK